MQVNVNGTAKELTEGITVLRLLEQEKIESPDMVSVQVNGKILKRPAFDTTTLSESDSIEFLYFMGGGA